MAAASLSSDLPAARGNAAIARHYDALDSHYRDVWGEHVHHGLWLDRQQHDRAAATNLSRHMLKALKLTPGNVVADIGCGYGATARLAAEEWGVHVTGLTLSSTQKQRADGHRVSRGSVTVECRDWREREFPAASLDALFSLESLEHMPDKAEFARYARRAVRSGGRVSVATWLAADHVPRWEQQHLLDAICREGRLAPLVTVAELQDCFASAGFVAEATQDLSAHVSRTWTLVMRRLAWRLATRPAYWRFLLGPDRGEAVFALTAARLRLAYARGCLRYGLLVWR